VIGVTVRCGCANEASGRASKRGLYLSPGLIPYVMCGRLGAKGVGPFDVAYAELAQWGRPWWYHRAPFGYGVRGAAPHNPQSSGCLRTAASPFSNDCCDS
jgi:hypothetical protein